MKEILPSIPIYCQCSLCIDLRKFCAVNTLQPILWLLNKWEAFDLVNICTGSVCLNKYLCDNVRHVGQYFSGGEPTVEHLTAFKCQKTLSPTGTIFIFLCLAT